MTAALRMTGFHDPAGRQHRLSAGLAASLALHAALLAWLAVPGPRHEAPAAARLMARLLPRLPESLPAEPSEATAAPAAPRSVGAPRNPAAPQHRSALPEHEAKADAPRDAPDASVLLPRIDAEAARNFARELAKGQAAPKAAGPLRRNDSPEAVLARRLQLGEPVGEKRMADGSVLLRFSGGACAIVQTQQPAFARNEFGPATIVPTNCPGTLTF